MGPRPQLWICVNKHSVRSTWITSLNMSQTSSVVMCTQISDFRTTITSLYGSQPSPVVLCMQNSDFRTRITSLYGSHTSPVDLCMLNTVLSTRITCLYGSHTSSVDFWEKKKQRALHQITSLYWFPHLTCGFLHTKETSYVDFAYNTACLSPELRVSMCLRLQPLICANKTACLAPELQVSKGPRLQLWL